MHTQSQNIKKSEQSEEAKKLYTKIKETWTELSDDDIRLYDENSSNFFIALEKKYDISKSDAEDKIAQLKKELNDAK